jgi:Family of unknown function (DUF5678)
MKEPHLMQHYYEPNDAYFKKHLPKVVKTHGGKWVVIAGGSLIGVSHEAELKKLTALARKRYPKDIPLIAPIPRKEELECIL